MGNKPKRSDAELIAFYEQRITQIRARRVARELRRDWEYQQALQAARLLKRADIALESGRHGDLGRVVRRAYTQLADFLGSKGLKVDTRMRNAARSTGQRWSAYVDSGDGARAEGSVGAGE